VRVFLGVRVILGSSRGTDQVQVFFSRVFGISRLNTLLCMSCHANTLAAVAPFARFCYSKMLSLAPAVMMGRTVACW